MTLFFRFLTIISLLIITYMSLQPAIPSGNIPYFDKLMHLGAYAVLAGLWRLGWPKFWGGWIFLGLAIFGIAIEFAQHMMGLGRTGSIADAVANMSGAGLALIVFHFLWTRHRR